MIKKSLWFVGLPVVALASNWVVDRSGDWEDSSNWQNGIIPNYGVERAVFNGTYTKDALIKVGTPSPVQMEINYAGGKTVTLEGASAEARHLIHTNATLNFSEGHVVLNNLDMDFLFPGNHALNVSADANKAAGRYSLLDLMGDSRFFLTGNLLIAGGNSPGGRVTVSDEASLTAEYLFVGRGVNAAGGLIQRGGTVTAMKEFSIGHNADTLGVYDLYDGELIIPDGVTSHMSINAGCLAGYYQHGGQVLVGGGGLIMGDASGSRSDFFIDGGTLVNNKSVILNNRKTASAKPGDCTFTVSGKGYVEVRNNFIFYGGHYATGEEVAQVNLIDGGTLFVRNECRQFDDSTAGRGYLAFNGGTLAKTAEGTDNKYFGHLDVVVYEKGMTFQNARRKGDFTFNTYSQIRGPEGWGVASITLTDQGEGYLLPPAVTITGGNGHHATAIAQIDYEIGCVTNVIVTCPGEGFAEDDTVTVTFSTGSAAKTAATRVAAATATLAKNVMGPIRVTGSLITQLQPSVDNTGEELLTSAWPDFSVFGGGRVSVLSEQVNATTNLTVEGVLDIGAGVVARNNGVVNMFPEAATVALGGYRSSESKLLLCGADPESDTTHIQRFADLTLGAGKDTLGIGRGAGPADLTIGSLSAREAGALFYAQPNTTGGFCAWYDAVAPAMLAGTASPIVIGAIAANTANESLGGLVRYDAATGALVPLETYDTAFGADANANLSGSVAASGPTVNSLLLENGTTLTLSQKTAVTSGMILFKDGGNATKITGGELTTGNGKDLILHDMHVKGRRATEANYAVVDAKIVDADADHPTALVVSGYKNATGSNKVLLKTGPSVQLTNTGNSYTGGTFLNDAAVDVADDGALGAVPDSPTVNIVAQGIAQIRAKNGKGQLTLHENRGIHIARDAVFSLTGDRGKYQVTTTINGPISGDGAIVTAEWAGGGKAGIVELNGDLSAFQGIYIPMGILRIPDFSKVSPRAKIHFGESDELTGVGEGIIETQGVIERTVGCEPGMVFWGSKQRQIADLANRDPGSGISGGFAAYGGPLTVSLKANDGAALLKWGTSEDYHKFTPKVLRLQNNDSTDPLYWTTGVNFDGATRIIEIGRTKADAEVRWSGQVYNDNATATLQKQGEGQLILTDGADISTNVTIDLKKGTVHFDVTNTLTSAGTLALGLEGAVTEKRGEGTVRLTGANTFADLAVKAGTLYFEGDANNAATVTVDAEAALLGNATVTVTDALTVAGAIGAEDAEGAPATLTVAGDLTVNGTVVSQLAAETNSLITVEGDLTFGAEATVEIPQVDLLAAREDAVTLMTATGAITGCPVGIDLPKNWKIRVRGPIVEAANVPGGTVIILK
ncbi:MAG: hypothetical protein J6334_03965 [Kiritimatiellae bacterium]|nr:hypothetical protein [Kiritimatiellia bacterium]